MGCYMGTIFPELEKAIPRLLKFINYKIESEKANIIDIVKSFKWYSNYNKDINKCVAIGVDSSFTIIESRIGIIYVIQGISIKQVFDDSTIKIKDYNKFYDIGLISIQSNGVSKIIRRSTYKRVLSTYAYLLELQSVYDLLKNESIDIVLFDGSLISFLMQREFKSIIALINSVENSMDINFKDILVRKINLIKELNKVANIVFVAKSSNAGFYTNGIYPDLYIFELARLFKIEPYYRTGYSMPITINVDKTLRNFLGIDDTYEIDFFTVTYSRFIDNAPTFQLSFLSKLDEEAVNKRFSFIKIFSPSGYPIPLEYPHRISKLTRSSLIDIFIKLGIPIASGRELVELS
jgi:soluble P-type ATPase